MPPLTATERQKLLLQQEIAKLSVEPAAAILRLTTPTEEATRTAVVVASQPRVWIFNALVVDTSANDVSRYELGCGGGYGNGGRRSFSNFCVDDRALNCSEAVTRLKRLGEEDEPWRKHEPDDGAETLAAQPPRPRQPKVPPSIQVLQSSSDTSPGGSEGQKRVVIDGVVFQFEQDGKKLTRIGGMPHRLSTADTSELPGTKKDVNNTPTRHSLKYQGENFRRTKRGNLISRSTCGNLPEQQAVTDHPRASARRAEQAKRPCRYYTKTGRCERALTCPYQHIPDRLAICHQFLKGTCQLGDNCPLSHTPSAHNTPSCSRFQATSSCYKGDKCLYPHVRVADDAPVCEAFAREGWCDTPAGTCPELHIWECPEWHAKGTCSRGRKCGLRHVLRAEKTKTKGASAPEPPTATAGAEGGFDDQAEFIGLPGEVFSETESEEEDDSDEEEGGSDEEEEEEENEDEEEDDDEDGDDDDDDDDNSIEVDDDSGKHEAASPTEVASDEDDERLVLDQV
ncbi:hypothetical protein A1Q1_06376 [Trichosporon asahii var. asahii CBS 2479]|uniref:C3H1-type domain-containing protein n=1 Tax=Trichosporon asahii var. asahii (strain ATCC 90039 / CBS 2479 / JCM 2466 / KCTC 7840 / NBRC 103889/ NCYC 2677 / UAMH 7654) TaxID=1186058 RepID=J5Q372_TRIAS|nr:hypothetical protein A1Q1_06376 [Trichosporon asahii var. asahii CBS 2479]EJT45238.1 hypothetical protein A1Q1_06376 [Trichosporon asahii var. asahii CBS 2479]